MAELALEEFVQRVLSLGVLEMEQIQEIWRLFGTQNVTLHDFLQMAIRKGFLTTYQVERLKFGETTAFFFGDYKVLYLIGSGTFSRVYRCVHRVTKQVVAVKVLRARFKQDEMAVAQFVREARYSMGLRHPNIVTVHDIVSDKNDCYMVMDFVEGQTLRDMIKIHKLLTPEISMRVTADILAGLDFVFQRGHSHRDIKLTNVLVSSLGRAVLIDFGLAIDEDVAQAKIQRTIDYAALEKVSGAPRNDKRSDIYFTGAILYHILTGVSPILETKDRAKRMERTRFLNVVPLREKSPQIPGILCFVVEKAMSLDPDKRYQSPGAMLRDVEIAAQKIATGKSNDTIDSEMSLASVARQNTSKSTILVMEDNPTIQDIFRDALKKLDYRVLVMGSPELALKRFESSDHGVDCVLCNAQSLGKNAVEAFNAMDDNPISKDIPAILLLAEDQVKWGGLAKRNKHRLAVGMPISMRRLAEVIQRLLGGTHSDIGQEGG